MQFPIFKSILYYILIKPYLEDHKTLCLIIYRGICILFVLLYIHYIYTHFILCGNVKLLMLFTCVFQSLFKSLKIISDRFY